MPKGPQYSGSTVSLRGDLTRFLENEVLSDSGRAFVDALLTRTSNGRFDGDWAYIRPK